MKLGLSLSRCIRDIYNEKVQETDVAVIISRTDFNPHKDEEWSHVWYGYTAGGFSKPPWRDFVDDHDNVRRLVARMYDNGLIHQPRQFAKGLPPSFPPSFPPSLPYHWLDLVVANEDLEELPAVKQAWEHYQIVANLCS